MGGWRIRGREKWERGARDVEKRKVGKGWKKAKEELLISEGCANIYNNLLILTNLTLELYFNAFAIIIVYSGVIAMPSNKNNVIKK